MLSFFLFIIVGTLFGAYWYIGFENRIADKNISLKRVPVALLISKYGGFTRGFLYDKGSVLTYKIPSRIIVVAQNSHTPYNLGRVSDVNGNVVVSSSAEFGKGNILTISIGISPNLKNMPDAQTYLNAGLELTFFQLTHDIQDINLFGNAHRLLWTKLQKSNFLFYPLMTIRQ